jgi:hypothetical protein
MGAAMVKIEASIYPGIPMNSPFGSSMKLPIGRKKRSGRFFAST